MKSGFNQLSSIGVKLVAITICLAITLSGANVAIAGNYDKRFLEEADFSGQVLRHSQFNKSSLRKAKFNNADLTGVSLFGADLTGADFSNADLSFSSLDTANLHNANLSNAILEGAFVYGARLNGVNIEGADFTDVDLRERIRLELCKTAKGKNSTTGRKTRDTLDCDQI